VKAPAVRLRLKDLWALGKPGITMMAVIVGAGTWVLAVPVVDLATLVRGFFGLCGVGLIVMGASAFNMVIERDVDGHMSRTRGRPVASGRMSPGFATAVGTAWSLLSLPLLWFAGPTGGEALSVALGLFSLFLYVLVYTPMKQRSVWSLVVGAVPGAMPALMGGTLATGRVEIVGVALFAVVFLWQLPHFLAISIYREAEYLAAGHKVAPTNLGVPTTRALIIASVIVLAAVGVALWPLGLGGPLYGVVAIAIGVWFTRATLVGVAPGLRGLRSRSSEDVWARKVFFGSLIWQTLVFAALGADRFIAAFIA